MLFILYAAMLLWIGLRDARRSEDATTFFLNGRASGAWHTGFSLIASCIGGSATIGMAGLAWQVGTPAFWWLGSGGCGLVLLTIFLARRVRESEVYTMPEIVAFWLGSRARTLVSCIIVPAWLAILAAQFTAMGKLTTALTGLSPTASLLAASVIIVAYSCLGGQAAVIRSDLPQCLLLLGGLFILLLFLWGHDPRPLETLRVELINKEFGLDRFSYFMVIMGGSYVVCPMLFGRILSASDTKSAILGCWLAVAVLFACAALIVAAGVLCRGFVPDNIRPDEVLTSAMGLLPPWAGMALLVALLSAVLSSADSCIVTASTVFCNDLLKKRETRYCRRVTLLFGAGAFILATSGHEILDLLLMANDIYVCGVVVPVFISMLTRLRCRRFFSEAAILAGGAGGLLTSLHGEPFLGYTGMLVSALLMLAGMAGRSPERLPIAR